MPRKKDRRVGQITMAIDGVDIRDQYPVALIAEINGDEGREYLLHVPPRVVEQVARLATGQDPNPLTDLADLLDEAIATINGLADQQAMPDTFYEEPLARLTAARARLDQQTGQ
jgi:hypothetical protein